MIYSGSTSKRLGLRLILLAGTGFLLLSGYQNCSRFDTNGTVSGANTQSSVLPTSPGPGSPSNPGTPDTPSNTGGGSPSNPGGSPSNPGGSTGTPAPSANLIWADEFDSFSLYDPATKKGNWAGTSINATDGGVGWGAEYDISPRDTKSGVMPYQVGSGNLTIRTDRAPTALLPQLSGKKYTSGALRTVNPSFGYAYYEMRAKMPPGKGLWPAFWLLPADGAWPPEIDVMEGLGSTPTSVYTTVHSTKKFASGTQGAMVIDSNHSQNGANVTASSDITKNFHTYGCDVRGRFHNLVPGRP